MLTKVTRSLFMGLALTAVCFLTGCGGGGTSQSATTAVSRHTGKVQLTVNWPALSKSVSSRYIPAYASSLYFELTKNDNPTLTYKLAVNRPDAKPSSQTIAFNQFLPVGAYTLAGVARADKDGQGATVASAATSVTVTEGATANVDLALISTIKALTILGQPLSLSVGNSLQLTGKATDPDGKILFVPASALTWTLVTGGSSATLTTGGLLTATAVGAAHIRLAESGAGISSETDVTITARGTGNGSLANSGWAKFHGDDQNTGQSKYGGATATVRWKTLIGTYVHSSAAIGADGTIYIGSDDKNVYALDGASGAVRWKTLTGGAVASSPAIGADGTVYVGSNDNYVYALDGASGAIKWKYQTGGYASSNPAIGSDGTIYIGSYDTYVYALDGAAGTVKWKYKTDGAISSSPAVGKDGTVYIGSNDSTLYAFDGGTGTVRWKYKTGGGLSSSPAIGADGTVYIGSYDTYVHAVDGASGTVKWKFQTTDNIASSPSIGADGTVYIVSNDDICFAINGATGVKKWQYQTGYVTFSNFLLSSPSIGVDGTVYVGAESGYLDALDPTTGAVKWQYNSINRVYSSPAIGADGTLYFGCEDGNVYALH